MSEKISVKLQPDNPVKLPVVFLNVSLLFVMQVNKYGGSPPLKAVVVSVVFPFTCWQVVVFVRRGILTTQGMEKKLPQLSIILTICAPLGMQSKILLD